MPDFRRAVVTDFHETVFLYPIRSSFDAAGAAAAAVD
jgi:hypothetical protein